MSLITELVQLFKQLDAEITDRKIRDHFVPIKEKFLELREEQFRLEQEHAKQMNDLKSAQEAEVRALKATLQRLEKSGTPELALRNGMYFKQSELGTENETPFCTFCYENSEKAVRLVATARTERRLVGDWKCPGCQTYFQTKSSKPDNDVVV